MVNGIGSSWGLQVGVAQSCQERERILCCILRELASPNPKNIGYRCEIVRGAHCQIAGASCVYAGRPLDKKRNPVAAFVDVSLVTAPVSIGLVPLRDKFRNARRRGASVVGGKDEDCILSDLLLREFLHDLSDDPVRFHYEVPIRSEWRFTLPFF